MRVLLVMPNFDAPLGVSIGLSYIAAALRRAGHTVAALHIRGDLGTPWDAERALGDVAAAGPGLVGLSSGFNHYEEMRALAAAIETRLGIPTMLGGVHATLNADQVLAENPHIRFVNVGEGEASMTALADALERGGDTTTIPNVQARVGETVHRNAPRPFDDLGDLPPMATDIWDFQRITDLRRGWVNVSAQRGCPYRCTYCHNNGVATVLARARGLSGTGNEELGFLRYRPAEDLIDELVGIRDRYAMQAFSFIDDTFTMNPGWLLPFLERYARDVRVPFVCNTTAVNLDENVITALAAAGCRLVRMGVESGSDRLRSRLMKRPFPETRLRWAFHAVQAAGMHALAFNMIGNVGETRAETLETFRFNASLRPTSMKLSLAHPYPGTEYHETATRADAIDPGRSTHNFIDRSVLRFDESESLWLDKVRTFYFWYVNRELGNDASGPYGALVDDLEQLAPEQWEREVVIEELWARHAALSQDLQARAVLHYTTPFAERTDLVVSGLAVADGTEIIRRELAEPH